MSRASKITFGVSCLVTAVTVVGVHIVQGMERETLHQGPIKDAKRLAEKKKLKEAKVELDDETKLKKRTFNINDHDKQQELRKKYETMQPLTGEVVTKDGEVVSSSLSN
ncbi:hypothetical protein KAFR_0L00870 [Kazachstania africana CBS 2517]|uniref:Uncharacterized protein n=1 Tax=Kazachstania africana (strain ATCC 22294 / BCRC 22015 / CBS 2517 / CECT 1963 / NBRC 1671 / NRRL Y-8276) TaxID=1071382 RepID=H2B245_KAZAF|nr:hypothetical protein KAFR_0L00870 [Kazachstania africana CBS 2517]CCF60695.1 hypothetical protein KAFR_0L00870 [Kazachstania africana CBS 2517]